jgi:hypothetical protein
VDVLGRTVGVMAGATIDTSNTASGGQIRVGGDYKGGNADVPNAQVTYVAPDAQLLANATERGDGGKVIVWADDTTRMYGSIEANGGAGGGNGGFIETSGKRFLDVGDAKVSARAPAGQAGTWLLDPSEIRIVAAPLPTPGPTDPPVPPEDLGNGPNFTSAANGSISTLTVSTLNSALTNFGAVQVVTDGGQGGGSGDIVFSNAGGNFLHINPTGGGASTLTLQAQNQIRFETGTQTFFQALGPSGSHLSVVMQTGLDGGTGGVVTDAGALVQANTFDNGNSVTLMVGGGRQWDNHGELVLNLNGKLDLNGGATFANHGMLRGATGVGGGVMGGTVNGGGTVQNLTEGVFNVDRLDYWGNFHFDGQAFSATSFDFIGGELKIRAQSGDVILAGGNANSVNASGAVRLEALNGSIQSSRTIGGESIGLTASGDVIVADLVTPGSTGAVGSGAVAVQAGGNVGYSNINTGGSSKPDGGAVTLSAGGGVSGGNIYTRAGSNSGSRGGAVQVTSGAAGVSVGYIDTSAGSTSFGSHGGGLTITSAGDVGVNGIGAYGGDHLFGGAGGSAGNVAVTSSGGDVTIYGAIEAYGGYSSGSLGGGGGGMVALAAAGNLTVYGDLDAVGGDSSSGTGGHGHGTGIDLKAGQNLQVGWLYANGGDSYSSGQGGNAANVNIAFGNLLDLGFVEANGGDGGMRSGGTGGTGGRGATVSITKESGDLDLAGLTLFAEGGWGGDGAVGGQGGQGGTVNLTAKAGGVRMPAYDGYTTVRGGWGGSADSASSNPGGRGGDGGAINITANGASELLGSLDAAGGYGGDGDYFGASRGGNGGNGGSINVAVTGPLVLGGWVSAGAGHGGEAADTTAPYPYPTDAARAGQNGAPGIVRIGATGGIVVPAPSPTSTPSPPALAASQLVSATSPTPAPSALYVEGHWTNPSALLLAPGAGISARDAVTNTGSVELGSGSTFTIGESYDAATGTYSYGGGSFTNGAGALLSGSGTVVGNVSNAGTVAPGNASSRIGALAIHGNFEQTATGRMEMDIAANAPPYYPGFTYDQLLVSGSATLGGQLLVASVPAVLTSSQLSSHSRSMLATAPVATSHYELLNAGAASGSFSLISGPPELLSNIRMNIGGSVLDMPGVRASQIITLLQTPDVVAALNELLSNSLPPPPPDVFTDEDDDPFDDEKKEGDIVVTDTSCTPS